MKTKLNTNEIIAFVITISYCINFPTKYLAFINYIAIPLIVVMNIMVFKDYWTTRKSRSSRIIINKMEKAAIIICIIAVILTIINFLLSMFLK